MHEIQVQADSSGGLQRKDWVNLPKIASQCWLNWNKGSVWVMPRRYEASGEYAPGSLILTQSLSMNNFGEGGIT